MLIRAEAPADIASIGEIHCRAFVGRGNSVSLLVDDLRLSLDVGRGVSLVACEGDAIVGHAMFTPNLLDAPDRLVDVEVLSPVGVLPEWQKRGVGMALVRHGLNELDRRGVPLVFLEGSPLYYSRFAFESGRDHDFRRPSLRIPDEAFQVCMLSSYEPWMTGTLIYRQTFWDHDVVGRRAATP